MKRIFSAVSVLMAAACFVFSSCSTDVLIRPVDSLLSPPLYYEEYEDLLEAFNKNVGGDFSFCHPQRGDYRSAIIVEDIDSDSQKEAFIFYKNSADTTNARMYCFDYTDGRWIPDGDFNGYGNGIDSIKLTDMDSDGVSELMVLWSFSGVSSGSIMSLYRAQPIIGEYREISNEACSVCEFVDVNGNGEKEVFFITQSNVSGVSQRSAKVMKLSGDSVALMGEARLDPNISSYTAVKTEKAASDEPMKIYVDALKGEQQMITELVYWDGEKSELCAPFLDAETMSNTVTLRYEPIGCSDMNNDGIIDIPVQSRIFGKGDNALTIDTENIYLTEWKNYRGAGLETAAYTLINYSDGYMVALDESEINTTGIRNYRSQNCWVVYKTNAAGESTGEIYSVLKIFSDRWDEARFSAYIPIVEKEDSVVCVYVTQNGKDRGIDEDFV
ncbi:MAG: hypothetical protein J6B52_06140, partial [Clostridia bacterium]|nr:hypothetical protein [Clostridia bacterium]